MAFVINYCEECGARIEEAGYTRCKAHRVAGEQPVPMAPRPSTRPVPSPSQRIRRSNSRRVEPITTRTTSGRTADVRGAGASQDSARAKRAGLTVALVMVGALVSGGLLIALSGGGSGSPGPKAGLDPGDGSGTHNVKTNTHANTQNASGNGNANANASQNNNAPVQQPAPAAQMRVEFADGTILTGLISPGEVRVVTLDSPQPRLVPFTELQSIELANEAPGQCSIRLSSGGTLRGALVAPDWRLETREADVMLRPAVLSRIGHPGTAHPVLPGPPDSFPLPRRMVDPAEIAIRVETPRTISFDRRPDGGPLRVGENLEQLFVPWGCVFDSSYESSFIAPDGYEFPIGSKGFSAANVQPHWQGIMTIRFCETGEPSLPAGVHCVGMWVAQVKPGGTTLEAWSRSNQLIASVTTSSTGVDYLGLHSPEPIARLRVVPNPDIDPDYAIDDLAFDTPRPLGTVAARMRVRLRNGDVVICRSVTLREDRFKALDTSAGALLVWPLESVVSVAGSVLAGATALDASEFRVRTHDGSVLRATSDGKSVRTVLDGREHAPGRGMAAAWGGHTLYTVPPADRFPTTGQALAMDGRAMAVHADWHLQNGAFTLADGRQVALSRAPMLWFGPEPEIPQSAGQLVLSTGECLVLGNDGSNGWHLVSWSSDDVVLQGPGGSIRVPVHQVVRCDFPAGD